MLLSKMQRGEPTVARSPNDLTWSLDPGTLGFELPFARFAQICGTVGFDEIETPLVGAAQRHDAERFNRLLELAGVRSRMFSCPWELPANGAVAEEMFAARLKALPARLRHARDCGAELISVFFNTRSAGMVGLSEGELVARCARLTELVSNAGMTLCVELNDAAHLARASHILASVAALGAPATLLLDVYHMFRSRLDQRWLELLAPGSIGWMHLSDVPRGFTPEDCESGRRCLPGHGRLDLPSLVRAAHELGYTGPLSIEVLDPGAERSDPLAFAAQTLDVAKHTFRDWIA
jgi:sugar phosphate isomerase/epimerase